MTDHRPPPHAAGVKVLIPLNPWDLGTQRCKPGGATCGGNANLTAETAKNSSYCDGVSDVAALAELITSDAAALDAGDGDGDGEDGRRGRRGGGGGPSPVCAVS